jgi:hypothetical protein
VQKLLDAVVRAVNTDFYVFNKRTVGRMHEVLR